MKNLEVQTDNHILYIYLNRPDVFNSFNREMSLELQEALDLAYANEDIRVVYLSGKGKAFCAGQDLKEAIDPDGPEIRTILEEHYNPLILRIRKLNKPVIAAVNGVAAGAGANLALACDIVVANEGASFIQAFSKIGLIPDCSGTFMLPRLIGWQRASALMMTADKVSAHEAQQMGMIYKVFANEDFELSSKSLAAQIADMPTKGLVYTKYALNESTHHALEAQLETELKFQILAAQTQDFKEGVDAFIEKRKPGFIGK